MKRLNEKLSASKALSLDVFDTLLLRNTKPEIQRFYEISSIHCNIIRNEGYNVTEMDVFVARQLAMKTAYHTTPIRSGEREASIGLIYTIMLNALGVNTQIIIPRLLQAELQYEKQNTRPNEAWVELIGEIRNTSSILIGFVSDMYLSSAEILALVEHHIPGLRVDFGIASSDYSLTKHGGGLYHVLLEKLHLDPTDILHAGDNFISDYVRAKNFGINAIHIPRSRVFLKTSRFRDRLFRLLNADYVVV